MEIKFYESADGQVPVRDFLDGLDIKMRQKMLRSIMALQEMGYSLRMPLSEFLEDGIFEVRVIVGKDSSRVLYFFLEEKRIVFTNGFKKKTQKAPKREIETAIRYRADYIKRVKK